MVVPSLLPYVYPRLPMILSLVPSRLSPSLSVQAGDSAAAAARCDLRKVFNYLVVQKQTNHNVPSMFSLSIKFYLRHVRYEDEECTPFLGISCWIGFQCRGIVAIGKPYDDSDLFGCRGSDSSAAIWFAVEHFEALVLKLFFFYTFYH